MRFQIYGILETDAASRRVLSFFSDEVVVRLDEEAGLIELEPVAGPGQIPVSERIDSPALPLREGQMTIGGERVRLVFLGRSGGDGSAGDPESLVYGLLDRDASKRLQWALGSRS